MNAARVRYAITRDQMAGAQTELVFAGKGHARDYRHWWRYFFIRKFWREILSEVFREIVLGGSDAYKSYDGRSRNPNINYLEDAR